MNTAHTLRSTCVAALSSMALVVGIAACGGPSDVTLTGTQQAVGMDGTVRIQEVEGGNRLLKVELEHLPPPQRLGPDLNTYILWLAEDGGVHRRASALQYNENNRTGAAVATTPSRHIVLTVTAESTPEPTAPSHNVIAKREIHF